MKKIFFLFCVLFLTNEKFALTPEKVREIRRRVCAEEDKRDVAAAFDITYEHLCRIMRRQCWAWVK